MKHEKEKVLILSSLLALLVFGVAFWVTRPGQSPAADPVAVPVAQVQAETLQSGYGDRSVAAGDFVTVKYIGALLDGTMFDANLSESEPFRTHVGTGTAFPGWDQGLLGMKIGERRKLTVPAALAAAGAVLGKAPQGETIVYDVELLEIQ